MLQQAAIQASGRRAHGWLHAEESEKICAKHWQAVPCNKADLACATKLQQWADYYQDQQGLLLPHAGIGGLEIAKNGINELEDRSKPTQDRSRGQMLSLAGAGLQ